MIFEKLHIIVFSDNIYYQVNKSGEHKIEIESINPNSPDLYVTYRVKLNVPYLWDINIAQRYIEPHKAHSIKELFKMHYKASFGEKNITKSAEAIYKVYKNQYAIEQIRSSVLVKKSFQELNFINNGLKFIESWNFWTGKNERCHFYLNRIAGLNNPVSIEYLDRYLIEVLKTNMPYHYLYWGQFKVNPSDKSIVFTKAIVKYTMELRNIDQVLWLLGLDPEWKQNIEQFMKYIFSTCFAKIYDMCINYVQKNGSYLLPNGRFIKTNVTHTYSQEIVIAGVNNAFFYLPFIKKNLIKLYING